MLSQLSLPIANLSGAGIAILGAIFAIQALKEIGVPSPGVTQGMLLYAGYQLTSGDKLTTFLIVVAIFLGSICGSALIYSLARFWGSKLLQRYGKYLHITPESIERAKAKLQSAAFLPVAIGRSVPGLMVPTSLASGTMRLPASKFAAGVGLSLIVWAGVFVGLGAVSGHVIQQILPVTEHLPLLLGLAAGGVLILGAAYFFWRRRGNRQLG